MPQLPTFPADAIVVLGGGVDAAGELTLASRNRVLRAVEQFEAEVAPRMILAGRCGLTEPDPPVTEAAAMARLAQELGVPRKALLLEEESRDTLGNAYFTRAMYLEPYGWEAIRVVTSDFHLSRAAWVFRKVLGADYDFSFVSAPSGFTPRELIFRALEECKLSIFLNEWLDALDEGDTDAVEHLMEHQHPGYADAPGLSHDQMRARLDEIAHINRIAGTQRWLASDSREGGTPPRKERRRGEQRQGDRRDG